MYNTVAIIILRAKYKTQMSIIKNIKQQARTILEEFCDQLKVLEPKLGSILPSIQPTSVFPQVDNAEQKQLEPVFVSLTVQDILETQFYYSYLIKKPVTKDSDVIVLKYGSNGQQEHNNINMEDYEPIMSSRETLVCLSDFYQSRWVHHEWKGSQDIQKPVEMKVEGQHQFKLGEKINAVCIWNPFEQTLFFVRLATQEQILKNRLEFSFSMDKEQCCPKQTRQLLLDSLNKFCSPNQAVMMMFSMMSEQPMFIDGCNFKEQLEQILPRVNHVNLKAPLKSSLFPYKNQEGVLICAPMQMSSAKTFVIIDFSQFSSQKQVKIGQEEIDNLKALKMFVEEGKTIYRWEYGESLLDHSHSGIIVKGSKIINPHFYINDSFEHKDKNSINPFTDMSIEEKHKIRMYIEQCLKRKPILSEQSRSSIEAQVKEWIEKNPTGKLRIKEVMQIARLNAKSMCRDTIELQDYEFASKVIN